MKAALSKEKMHFADKGGLLVLIRMPLGRGEFGHPHLLGIQLDLKHLYLCLASSGGLLVLIRMPLG